MDDGALSVLDDCVCMTFAFFSSLDSYLLVVLLAWPYCYFIALLLSTYISRITMYIHPFSPGRQITNPKRS